MTGSTRAIDVVIELPTEQRTRGYFGENFRFISQGCRDQICLVIEGKDPQQPITWEIGGRSIILCDAGEHYHPRRQYGEEPVEGGVVYLNPVDQEEALWGVSNAETTPQQLWNRGLFPIAVVRRDVFAPLDWVVFHQHWKPVEEKQEPE